MGRTTCVGMIVAVAMMVVWAGPALADDVEAAGLRVLTAEEMGRVCGGLDNYYCAPPSGDPLLPTSWQATCLVGVTGCFKYNNYCVEKTHYMAYNVCVPVSGHQCGQWNVHCFKGTRYSPDEGGKCNGGVPGAPCTGAVKEYDYMFGNTVTLCNGAWIAL